MASPEVTSPIGGLHVSLSQPSTSPLVVRATVTNKNDFPITILTYGSPLDSLAGPLGLLTITPEDTDKPLELQTIMLRRIWPPNLEQLVTLRPGESESNDIELKEPFIPMEKLTEKVTVGISGKWQAVWEKTKDEVSSSSLENIPTSPDVFLGDFEAGSITVTTT
ncbi:hypothetical protein B0I35DRAFT_446684 [Stachybotrys elegans]|uniref:Uncharacterized protein n=1 Tax=Stachybotrys elegans TaxID=80388 RepID=A0A8K0SDU9_9HYPO|nr:hypothetical protein B0I35DRAFT_446684 [Stachybotrys elegans]